ncbi:MAG: Glycosyl hydrolases family 43 [Candidatus Latescibacteria bacterium ADurb.Bin168]|nr:MAG: Glycosyl hydrolases family 43 [Candidatus Latescibacteria bacterium ADurb.Bin168]
MDVQSLAKNVQTPFKHGSLILAPSFRPGDFDNHGVDCPFVFRHEDRFLMTYIGFDGHGYRTGLAWSDDLFVWHKEGMILDRGIAGSVTQHNAALTWILRDNELFGTGRLRQIDGRYVGTYHAYPALGYENGPAVIGICSSTNLRDWEVSDPCLIPTEGEEWERGGLYKSCLIEFQKRYYLFYNAKTAGVSWIEQTGVAISDDLVRWERFQGNPILRTGAECAFDERFASDPCVLRVGDAWAMFYFGLSRDGHARDSVAFSRDLLHWEKSGSILVDVGPPGAVDSRYAHKPSLFWDSNRLFHFYCAVSPRSEQAAVGTVHTNETRGISVAFS